MKKRLLAFAMASVMAVGLAGCGGEVGTGSTMGPGSAAGTGSAAGESRGASGGEAAPEIVLKYAELNSDDNINTRVGYEDAGEKASEWNKDAIEEEEVAIRKDLESKGVTIVEMTSEDKAAAQAACEPVWADYAEGIEELLQKMIAVQK